jgi:hypothetical protein
MTPIGHGMDTTRIIITSTTIITGIVPIMGVLMAQVVISQKLIQDLVVEVPVWKVLLVSKIQMGVYLPTKQMYHR